MNERIKELVKQFADDLLSNSGYDMREFEPFLKESEKFAELIIKEAGEAAAFGDPSYSPQRNIYHHFGML
jgi:hypothetical protein